MTVSGALPPARVPTLTEEVAWPLGAPPAFGVGQFHLPVLEAQPAEADIVGHPMPLRIADEAMIEGVLIEVQRQVELMLDYRLREVLTPLLARAADSIVREARAELASTLRDLVARAVAQELARHRTR